MLDHDSAKIAVLDELMEKMRDLDGGRIKPKAVEVSVEAVKPGPGLVIEGEPDGLHEEGSQEIPDGGLDMHGAQPGLAPEHQEPDGDELSPEDVALLDQLFGGKDSDGDQDGDKEEQY